MGIVASIDLTSSHVFSSSSRSSHWQLPQTRRPLLQRKYLLAPLVSIVSNCKISTNTTHSRKHIPIWFKLIECINSVIVHNATKTLHLYKMLNSIETECIICAIEYAKSIPILGCVEGHTSHDCPRFSFWKSWTETSSKAYLIPSIGTDGYKNIIVGLTMHWSDHHESWVVCVLGKSLVEKMFLLFMEREREILS